MPSRLAGLSILEHMAPATRAYACLGLVLIAVHLAVGGSVLVYELVGATSS